MSDFWESAATKRGTRGPPDPTCDPTSRTTSMMPPCAALKSNSSEALEGSGTASSKDPSLEDFQGRE